MPGSKHIYLGLYESEDQAAKVCDLHTSATITCSPCCCLCCPSTSGSMHLVSRSPQYLPMSMHALERRGAELHDMPGLCARSLQAYDRSLVRLRGSNAATNFSISDYRTDLADYYKMQQVCCDSRAAPTPKKNADAP